MIDLANKVYFDKIRYVLSNIPKFDLTNDELIIVLAILLLRENNEQISVLSIQNLTDLDERLIDTCIETLAAKRYLEIVVDKTVVNFSVDNLFNLKEVDTTDVKDIFKIFEDEFARILTQRELVKINEWLKEYERDEIIEALRSASIMNKLNFNYIHKILENNRNE
ncbi:MAG: DnaD domain protein [Erysipelothrix sp.]|nr:DnaD domain protein [Erysipelothrix sp.]